MAYSPSRLVRKGRISSVYESKGFRLTAQNVQGWATYADDDGVVFPQIVLDMMRLQVWYGLAPGSGE